MLPELPSQLSLMNSGIVILEYTHVIQEGGKNLLFEEPSPSLSVGCQLTYFLEDMMPLNLTDWRSKLCPHRQRYEHRSGRVPYFMHQSSYRTAPVSLNKSSFIRRFSSLQNAMLIIVNYRLIFFSNS